MAVDIEGHAIKLTMKDAPGGKRHRVPLDGVGQVDDRVYVSQPGNQTMRDWTTTPPEGRPMERYLQR